MLNYSYQNFVENFNVWRSINGNLTDTLESGLISKHDWEWLYRYYIVSWPLESANDISAINISGINNSVCSVDYELFVICRKECVVDVQTGFISDATF